MNLMLVCSILFIEISNKFFVKFYILIVIFLVYLRENIFLSGEFLGMLNVLLFFMNFLVESREW